MSAPMDNTRVKVRKQDGFIKVRKRDLERLTTEVMQLREFLPRVLSGDLTETLRRALTAETLKEQLELEHERLRQEYLHLQSRLCASQAECQKEREEKLLLREQLWRRGVELQQQVNFCYGLGSAACGLLWSSSARENVVTHWVADGKLQPFLAVGAQTLESFVGSLDEEAKSQTEDHNSLEHQFILALAGTITNIAAVTCGRDLLSSSAHPLLDTLVRLPPGMKPGVFPKLKVLMLMALYNVSISVQGLKYISENSGLLHLIWTLLDDEDWEVCLHTLRLLQSVLAVEDEGAEEGRLSLGSSLLDPELRARVSQLTYRGQSSLRLAAHQTLGDLEQVSGCKEKNP
ncbi:heat shock factor 2-binding protein [Nelusetta ayraudi]|uniref:heat shock factor 2-binding protein n=1 Tax=Nelusetta ayraudi TaxID=303726 RepID=UPI003F71746D